MPIIKSGPRIIHMYRQLKGRDLSAFDNDDLRVIGDTADTWITTAIYSKDAQLSPAISRYQDGKVAFGYRPFGMTILGCGFFMAVFAAIGVLGSFVDKSLSGFFIAMGFLLLGLGMMWHGAFSAYRHFVIFDRANGLVHISTRLRWWKYISLRWQDASFVNGHWLLPDPYKTRPKPTYDIKLIMPPHHPETHGRCFIQTTGAGTLQCLQSHKRNDKRYREMHQRGPHMALYCVLYVLRP